MTDALMAKCTVAIEVHSILITTPTNIDSRSRRKKSWELMIRLSMDRYVAMGNFRREERENERFLLVEEGQVQH